MKAEIRELIEKVLPEAAGLNFVVEETRDFKHGDYATNVALIAKQSPAEMVEKILAQKPDWLEKVEMAGPGFINFHLAPQVFATEIKKILAERGDYGKNKNLAGQKIIIEYTDPNPFKEFHIGHLMSNAIGESISRLIEWSGAEVKRACYQGDVGLHVAKAIWGLQRLAPGELNIKVLGEAYALGATSGDEAEIKALNKKIYDRSDGAVNQLYDAGRQVSLDYFETIYQKLGTKFDFKFFESETGEFGRRLVGEHVGSVFESSDGAVVFRGEEAEGLHTRVFINSEGLPTYEAKELGLAKLKYDAYPYDQSVVITGNEVRDYFRVILKALSLVFPDLAAKTRHVAHGMLRLPSGKMSSRTGEVITADFLLGEAQKAREGVTESIAVGAIKYSILKQSPGKDIIFDLEKSLSFEGDSGPYLQYTRVRTRSILAKAGEASANFVTEAPGAVEKLLLRFGSIAERAAVEFAPNYIVTYLLELSSAFNAYYAQVKIIGSEAESYRLALTAAVAQVLENGLGLLGIPTPEKM